MNDTMHNSKPPSTERDLLITDMDAMPYGDHWSFAYRTATGARSDYDFRVEFDHSVGKAEELAVVHLIEAAPKLLAALLDALPYVEDVLGNPEQLACFKKGVVQKHSKAIRDAIAATKGLAA